MIFHSILLTILLWGANTACGSNVVRIDQPHTFPQSFRDGNQFVYHLESDSILSISRLQNQLEQGAFTLLPRLASNYKKTERIHYLAIHLENQSQEEKTMYWLHKNAALNKIKYYIVQDSGTYTSSYFGDHYPFNARPNHFFLYGIPLSVPPNSKSICFVEIDKRNENLFLAFNLYSPSQYEQFKTRTYGIFGIMVGILIALVVFNLISYLTLKESIHLWYIPYALSNLYVILAFEGVDFQFIYPDSPFFSNISRYVATAIQLSMATLLMRKFLSIALLSRQNRVQRLLTALVWFNFLSIPLTAAVYHPDFALQNQRALYLSIFSALNMLNMILIVVVCIRSYRKGLKHAMFFIAAIGFVFLGGLEYSLNVNGIIMNNLIFPALIPNSLDYGIMIETLIVSIGLVYRFDEIKRERDRIAADIKIKVLELQQASVVYRSDERKRIANFIHDQIGSRLFGARMHMHALMAKPNSAETPEIELTTRELDTVSKKTREIIDKLQELEQIPIVECIATCVNTLEEFASKSKFPVILKELTVADNAVVSQKFSHHIELILREVLHNTQKYALPQAQEIAIKSSEGLLVIDINEINNFKNPLPLKEGSGITSIKSRAMDLHGTIEFYYSEGLCIRVSAPLHHQ